MPIDIISNFDLKQSVPIDTRFIATSSSSRNSIQWRYEGLRVYQTDDKKTYLWNGLTWSVDGSGIYGGSGSLLGDTLVSFGTMSSITGSNSFDLSFGVDYTSTKSRMINKFVRHSDSVVNREYAGVEYRQQLGYFNSNNTFIPSTYIGFNSLSPNDYYGDLTFNLGDTPSEKLRLTKDGYLGISTNDPKEIIQIESSLPFIIRKGDSDYVLAYNWNSIEGAVSTGHGSSKIEFLRDGQVRLSNRVNNTGQNAFVTSIYVNNNGQVGIGTEQPGVSLDVTGQIRNTATVSTTILSASSRVLSPNYRFSNTSNFNISGNNAQVAINNGTASIIQFQSNQVIISNTFSANSNASVGGNFGVIGNIEVTGLNSRITNYEDPTTLTPTAPVMYSNNGTYNLTSNTIPLNQFTYSFYFYRVGALVHVDYTIRHLSGQNWGSDFFGLLLRFDNQRFKPTSYSIGSGFGEHSSNVLKAPILTQVFTSDGTNNNPSVSENQFYLKISTFKGLTENPLNQGGDFNNSRSSLCFKGTITYLASTNTQTIISGNSISEGLGE